MSKRGRLLIGTLVLLSFVGLGWKLYHQANLNDRLIDAVNSNDTTAVERLLNQGGNANVQGPTSKLKESWNKRSLLQRVAGQLSGWARLVKQPVLILAAQNQSKDIVNLLLSKGAEVDGRTERGETALMIAARSGNIIVMRSLLDAGANIHARDRSGNTSLMWAAFADNEDGLNLLLNRGADVNAKGIDGATALMYAASLSNPAVADVLLRNGAEVNARDNMGNTALTIAKEQKRDRVAARLQRAGASD